MDEQIKSKLALQIAQLSLNNATLEASLEISQARISELENLVDNQTSPDEGVNT